MLEKILYSLLVLCELITAIHLHKDSAHISEYQLYIIVEGITINLQKVEALGIDDQKARAITMNQFILALRKVVAPNIFFI